MKTIKIIEHYLTYLAIMLVVSFIVRVIIECFIGSIISEYRLDTGRIVIDTLISGVTLGTLMFLMNKPWRKDE